MRLSELAELYERIEGTSKRLEIRHLLAEVIPTVPEAEIDLFLYLLQGQLRPEYEGIELGMADSLARKALALVSGGSGDSIKELAKGSGDLGDTARELLEHRPRSLDDAPPLELTETYQALWRMARATGEGSQEVKVRTFAELMRRASPVEAKHLVRFVLGKLRLGVKEMTLLDALAEAFGGPDFKEARSRIEEAFNVTSDLGEIGRRLRQGGLAALREVRVAVGKPVRPMLAEREPSLAAVLKRMPEGAAFEYKYDGLRIQAHIPAEGPPRLFSRRLEDIGAQFPELLAALPSSLASRPAIVEGECVPVDPETGDLRPFQEISRRRGRKHDLEKYAEEVPIRYLLFDLLLQGEESLLGLPYPERRRRLEELLRPSGQVGLATRREIGGLPEAESFFQEALADGCEGIMAKSMAPGSTYRAGARGFWWIKYKREYTHELADTIDVVVVGAFWGRGKRAGKFGAFLVAAYDPDTETFATLCKVGSGFDEESLEKLTADLRGRAVPDRPEEVTSHLVPDVWLEPSLVLEIRGAELSLSPVHRAAFGRLREGFGLALRFPRYTGRLREDKAPEQATTTGELVRLYQNQVRKAAAEGTGESSEGSPPT